MVGGGSAQVVPARPGKLARGSETHDIETGLAGPETKRVKQGWGPGAERKDKRVMPWAGRDWGQNMAE